MKKTSKLELIVRGLARRLPAGFIFEGSTGHCLWILLFYSLLFTVFFSPALFYGSLLAPGDGLLYHVAYFQSKKVLWDPLLASGFPMIADSQVMAWYPPALLLSFIPGGWNVFVVSAYVMASCFTYGYVFTLTRSKLSSAVSGVTYGMCGFMMAHLGHTTIIHSAVWLPLIIWSLEILRRRFSRAWFAIGCLAIASCVLAGHLQIVSYSLLLSAAYAGALGWTAPVGRRRFYLVSVLLVTLGLGLTALQTLPTSELARLSTRADYSFADFVSYSLPLKQISLIFFPALFGGLSRYGVATYFGRWNLTELTGHVGLLPFMLAAMGFVASRRNPIAIFWLCVGVLAFLLALGDQTPLAYLTYQLPVLGKFRAPARHLIEMAFAVSVLSGMGVEAIRRRTASGRLVLMTVSVTAGMMIIGVLVISNKLGEYAIEKHVALSTLPWSNPTVGIPLLVFLAGGGLLLYWYKKPDSLFRQTLLLSILVLDLASFGWFHDWHDFSPGKKVLIQPASAGKYKDLLRDSHQRVLPARGVMGTVSELPPNLSRLWDIPNATGYGPLTLSRMTDLLSTLPDASVASSSLKNAGDQGLNLAAVRYLYLPRSEIMKDERGISWQTENMDIWLGPGCDHPYSNSLRLNINKPFQTTKVGIVSRLACSLPVKEGEEVARVLITDVAGNVQTQSLFAGRDTSEWSYDCRIVKPQMLHNRATIFSSFPAMMFTESCQGHYYLAMLNLNSPKEISSIDLQWVGHGGAITIEKVSLINELNGSSYPVSPLAINSNRWQFEDEVGQARIYENLQAMPRAWLASQAITLKPDEILNAIKTSRLPDGRPYDPLRMALVEVPLTFSAEKPDEVAFAGIVRLNNTVMEVQTSSSSPALLLTSDVYYPGWEASVDGVPAQLFISNYAFRGVKLSAGTHLVKFSFKPKSFYYGLTISALSLAILAGFLFWPGIFVKRIRRGDPNLIS